MKFAEAARPFATYLIARRGQSDSALRWARISRDVTGYEQKLPDNGLSALDAFVRRGVPAMIPANACGAGSTGTARAIGEYFPALRDELAREGERQCRIQIQRDYAAVVSVFNAQLRDRFPFVEQLVSVVRRPGARGADPSRGHASRRQSAARRLPQRRRPHRDAVSGIESAPVPAIPLSRFCRASTARRPCWPRWRIRR